MLGRSGTGKSVMLRHIVGLMAPDSGRVLVLGQDLTRLSPPAIAAVRRQVGFLFQNAALFDSLTVGENVAFPLRRHTRLPEPEVRARAQDKLALVGLARDYEKMPAALSGGMRKRAGLARAMALDPAIPPRRRAERRPRPDHVGGDRRPARAGEGRVGHDPGGRDPQHSERAAHRRHLVFLYEGRVLERGDAARLERSGHPIVRQFLASEAGG